MEMWLVSNGAVPPSIFKRNINIDSSKKPPTWLYYVAPNNVQMNADLESRNRPYKTRKCRKRRRPY